MSKSIEEKNKVRLFLDDFRNPIDCTQYMYQRGVDCKIYHERWFVVKNYKQFIHWITKNGLPDIISFDHDLADEHYGVDYQDWEINSSDDLQVPETGMDCAKWLTNYCIDNNTKLPEFYVHSMNPVGRENIQKYLESFKKQFINS